MSDEVYFDTGSMRQAAVEAETAGTNFVKDYDELKTILDNTPLTGPVMDTFKKALNEKEKFVNEVRGQLGKFTEGMEDYAARGDKLIDNIQNNTL